MSTELLTVAATLLGAQVALAGMLALIMLQSEKRSVQRTERLGAELKGELAEMRAETKRQFERVDDRFERMEAETKRQFERVDERFERMEAETKRQFEQAAAETKRQFERVDDRFDEMAAETKRQFEQVDERFDRMAAETKRLFEAMDVRIRGLENGQARLAAELSMLKDIFTHNRPRE